MDIFSIDFETRSVIDLKKRGAHIYAKDPSTEVVCMGWRRNDEPVQLWRAGLLGEERDDDPEPLLAHIANGGFVLAHNASFERVIWDYVIGRRYNWPGMRLEQWYCTAAAARASGLPGALEKVAQALGSPIRKDMAGHKAMLKICSPTGFTPDGDPIWHEDPATRDTLFKYCMQDVETERAIGKQIPLMSREERAVWCMIERMNDRGVRINVERCQRALPILDAATAAANARMVRLTDAKVKTVSSHAAMASWVRSHGIECESVSKDFVGDLIAEAEGRGYDDVAEALNLKADAAKASVAKYKAFLAGVEEDGRARGTTLYHGATTGRMSSVRLQLNNVVGIDWDEERDLVASAVWVLDQEHLPPDAAANVLEMMTDTSVFLGLSKSLRPMLEAAPGHRLVGGDWSNIEGRINAWLGNEHWKLDAFRAFDAGTGADLYKVAYAKAFSADVKRVDKSQRALGKIIELSCIAEGQLVVTDRGLVPIEAVRRDDKVWDGLEWVSHDGVIYRGERECIQYDGLTATPDHIVWVEGESWPVAFGDAAASQSRLERPEYPRTALRFRRDRDARVPAAAQRPYLRGYALRQLRPWAVDMPVELDARQEQGLPSLRAAATRARLARASSERHATAVHKSQEQRLLELRGPRHPVSLRERKRLRALGYGELGAAQVSRLGSYQQRRALRAGQSALGDGIAADAQLASVAGARGFVRLGRNAQPLCLVYYAATAYRRAQSRRDRRAGEAGRSRETEGLASHPTAVGRLRVYDLLNCGPRHRFVVSGVLVHNCGFAGGKNAVLKTAKKDAIKKKKPMTMSAEQADELKTAWRASHPGIVQLWRDLERAAISAVENPGTIFSCADGRIRFHAEPRWLVMTLPSERTLRFRDPFIQMEKTPWGEERPSLKAWQWDNLSRKGEEWKVYTLWQGILIENPVQAIAADVLRAALFELDRLGIPYVLTVHDEIVCEVPNDHWFTQTHLEKIMTRRLPWTGDLPLAAACWEGTAYGK